jgi:hypothetical protein
MKNENNKDKSYWWLIIDIPLAVIMTIIAVIGVICTLVEISYCFGRQITKEWYIKKYDNKLF